MAHFNIFASYPIDGSFGFQDPASSIMYAIIDLHDRVLFYLIILAFLVSYIFIRAIIHSPSPDNCSNHLAFAHHGSLLETIWTIAPGGILWAIGLPSLRLLYMMDAGILGSPDSDAITVKAMGNQWYWSYEHVSLSSSNEAVNGTPTRSGSTITLDSFPIPYDSLEEGQLRNLQVDNFLVLPASSRIQLLVSSNDVIHSFAVPALGLKIDAIPGRLQSTELIINRPSTYFGQCSELCGVLHGFMPIGIRVVPSIPQYLCAIIADQD